MPRISKVSGTVAVIISAGWSTAAGAQLAQPVIDTVAHHIVRVTNRAPSEWTGYTGWRLVPVATIEPPFGAPGALVNPSTRGASVAWTDDEQLLVIDEKPAAIKRYDVTGKYLGQIGRDGSGPGEYQRPSVAARDQRLLVFDAIDYEMESWTAGKPGRTWQTGSNFEGFPIYLDTLGRAYDRISLPDPATHRPILDGWERWPASKWSGSAAPSDTLPVPTHDYRGFQTAWDIPKVVYAHKPFVPFISTIIDRAGDMIWGFMQDPEWFVSRTGRDTLRIFVLADTAPSFPVAARDSIIRAYAADIPAINTAVRSVAKASDLPDHYPVWREVTEDKLGHLWISRYGPGGTIDHFDVLDPAGRWLGSVRAPGDLSRAYAFGRDHFAEVVMDANDLPEVRIFRIDRNGH